MEYESDGDNNCTWRSRYSHQRIGKGIGRHRNKRTSGDHLIYSMVEIGQNTKKTPEDFDSRGKTSVNAGLKNFQMSKIIHGSPNLDQKTRPYNN